MTYLNKLIQTNEAVMNDELPCATDEVNHPNDRGFLRGKIARRVKRAAERVAGSDKPASNGKCVNTRQAMDSYGSGARIRLRHHPHVPSQYRGDLYQGVLACAQAGLSHCLTASLPPATPPMIDDQDLGFFANFLGVFIFVLVIAYHYVVADPKYEGN
ncbi:hypothetical protein SO802_025077 [Lithocarpus litseifolius]